MTDVTESRMGHAYRITYAFLCGSHPKLLPWHFQWLSSYYLNRSLKSSLIKLGGRILDVGCGKKPYKSLFGKIDHYIGIDISRNLETDIVASLDDEWPLPDDSFDVVLMSQVMEYMRSPEVTAKQIWRVLRPNGIAVISFPFIYNEHGHHDYVRLSARSIESIFSSFTVRIIEKQGGIGSTFAILFLNWLDTSLNKKFALRIVKSLIIPLWLPFCFAINIFALVFNRIDTTESYYSNVFMVLEKNK